MKGGAGLLARASTPMPADLTSFTICAVLVFELVGCSRRADPHDLRTATCLGPAEATHFAVYLHGVDEPSISEQELQNRRSLDAISSSLSLRIALPRASRPCPNQPSSLCWGWAFDEQEIDAAADAVKLAATSCASSRCLPPSRVKPPNPSRFPRTVPPSFHRGWTRRPI